MGLQSGKAELKVSYGACPYPFSTVPLELYAEFDTGILCFLKCGEI